MEPTSLTRALALTHALADAVSHDAWERAAALVNERAALLMSLDADQTPDALAIIREIQRLDAIITEQAMAGRERLMTNHRLALQRIDAASRYQSTGMLG
ncbi:flagellar protein FliT [Burkholderia sp. AU33545]|uniref:flagellar protein FliT n=1 Tax=Burkholderia sp. AU33545 TaxID=2879631 RepID=UPI001CF3BE04|nr:flagellar protein FliT [Burkholderia sp. AU33545]MCA8205532.1 flagellar protein FliT [Burkholderia sp. AU33545]